MNSKNGFIKIAILLFLIALQGSSFAQTFKYESPRFKISLPSLRNGNPGQTDPYPYYTIFLETGDGYYIKDTNHIDVADINNPDIIPYNMAIPGRAVLNVIAHYDTIKPPRELYTWTPNSNSTTDAPPQITLPTNKKIGFAYADKTVAIGHTMTYVVTYKPDSLANTVVAFFYNDNNSLNGQKVFSEITRADQSIPFTVSDGTTNTTQDIKVIRVKESTTSISIAPPQGLPSQVADMLTSSKGSFNNAIYFVIPYSANNNERNAFISMIEPLNTSLIGSFANLKAVLITYNNRAGYISKDSVTDVLPISQFASDPNGIETTPHCLNSIPGGPFNKPINYQISFHNDGDGYAKKVKVTVWVPEGIQLNPSQTLYIKSTVSRKIIIFSKPDQNIKQVNTYEIITNGTERKIIFTMPNIKLPGRKTTSTSMKDLLERQGRISFSLYTIPDPGDPAVIRDKLTCMYSDVSIAFYNLEGNREYSIGQHTGSDLIRKSCHDTSPNPPPCPRLLKAVKLPPNAP